MPLNLVDIAHCREREANDKNLRDAARIFEKSGAKSGRRHEQKLGVSHAEHLNIGYEASWVGSTALTQVRVTMHKEGTMSSVSDLCS